MHPRARHLALLSLLLAPLLWLWPCVFGDRTFVPYDVAQFPPASLLLSPEQLAAASAGANHDVTEPPVWFVPELELAGRELRAGRWPGWNPHARGGAPLHAHGLIGLCYPPNWLLLVTAEPATRLGLVTWINLALGGLLAFGLLRKSGLATLPAWFGALLFELSAPMATNAFFWMRLGSFVWLPGVLWAVLAIADAERLRARHLAGLGVAVAMAWLAGFPPFAATTTLLGGGFALWLLVARWRRAGASATRRLAARLLLGFALGGCLALPQVLPSLQFFPHSARETKPGFQRIADQSFESYGLLGYLWPDALGHPSDTAAVPYSIRNPLGLLWNTRQRSGKPAEPNFNYTEYAVFVGQLGALLAVLGALAGRGGGRGFALAAWLGCAGLALFWPGLRLLYLLPLVENVWPLRWLAPASLFMAWLAGIGLQRLLDGGRRWPLALAAAALALGVPSAMVQDPSRWTEADSRAFAQQLADRYGVDLAGAVNHVQYESPGIDRFRAAQQRLYDEAWRAAPWLLGSALWLVGMALAGSERWRRWLGLAAGVAAAVQLGLHGASMTRGIGRTAPPQTPVHTFLRQQANAASATGGFMVARGADALPLPSQLPPGQLLAPGLRDLQFYSHFDGRSLQPLQRLLGSWLGTLHASKGYLDCALPHTLPPAAAEAEYASGRQPRDYVAGHPFEHPLLDLLGVRYVLSVGPVPLPHTGAAIAIEGCPPSFHVQERTSALPRAFAVDTVQPHRDDASVVQALLQPTFAPLRIAHALAAELPTPLPDAASDAARRRPVRFVRDEPTTIELDVDAGAQPWLLLTDTFLPGWTATIDGRPQPIVRGDHAFRLVALPAQSCRVVFTYRCPGLAMGTAMAGFATLAWLLYAFTTKRRHSPRPNGN
ncbi:MAG: YfhO family protein [Planctomycetes bacterium]|nr:YfhO family protein [Planctomycetota bacterium]